MSNRFLNPPNSNQGLTPEQAQEEEKKVGKLNTQLDAIMRGHEYTAENYARLNPTGDPDIAKNLEGMTVKFDPTFGLADDMEFDTGIEYNPHVAAIAVGMGDQMGDAARGIAQILKEYGLADIIDTAVQDQNEAILRQLYDDNTYGGAAMTGAVVGAVAEPVGLLMPLGKLTSAVSAVKAVTGAAVLGGLYGSSLYIDGEESRMKNAAFGAATMGGMGYLMHRMFRNSVGRDVDESIQRLQLSPAERKAYDEASDIVHKQADEMYPRFKQASDRVHQEAQDFMQPYTKVHKEADELTESYTRAADKVQREADEMITKAGGKVTKPKVDTPEDVMQDIELRAASTGSAASKVSDFKRIINQVIQPIYDNIKQYHPKIAAKLRDADFHQHRKAKVWTDRTKGFNDWFDSIPVDKQELVHKALRNGFTKETIALMRQLGGGAHASDVQKVLKDILTRYKSAGYKIKNNSQYFPTSVRPDGLEHLVSKQRDQIDKILAKESKRVGRALTSNEKNHIMERLVSFDIRYSNVSGNLKKRSIQELDDELLRHYHDPVTALHYYVASASEDIAKREFFKSFGYTPPANKGLDVSGADIIKSIDTLIDTIKHEIPSFKDREEVVKLLSSRFSADVHKTHRFVQAIKNVSYAGTLGNFWSAMTQVGDLVFAAHKYGIMSTAEAIAGAKVGSKEALGIEKAMQELNSDRGITNKLVDWAFKWSGFSKVDDFGKNVNVNASLRYNKKLAMRDPDAFKKKWGDHFDDDIDTVIHELSTLQLKKGDELSDNVQLLLWNDLADTQPIGLSEMPKKYLDMPNGRIAYAYKTFAMKQFSYLRNAITNKEMSAFQRGKNAAYFTTMFVMANSTIDAAKDVMSNKEVDIEDIALDNIISMVGSSKFAFDKGKGLPLGGMIYRSVEPVPLTQLRDVFDKVGSGDVGIGDIIDQQPLVGKINREWDVIR